MIIIIIIIIKFHFRMFVKYFKIFIVRYPNESNISIQVFINT